MEVAKKTWTIRGILRLAAIFSMVFDVSASNLLDNPGFETGSTAGWLAWGGTSLSITTTSHSGTYSALISNRTDTWNGIVQSLLGYISNGQTFTISGWVMLQGVSSDNVMITIQQIDDSGTNYHRISQATVYDSGWTNLSGFFTLHVTGTLTGLSLYFEGPVEGVNFYVDDVSVEIADSGDWETEANERIEQIRKGDFKIIPISPYDHQPAISDVNIQINQIKHHFAFGSAISRHEMENSNYLNFFKDHFEWAVMENASKWYANEPQEDYVTYEDANKIYTFCNSNDITMRGHCIFWASENMVQDWIKALDNAELQLALEDRLNSAVNYFKGKFVHWDVNNEMCDNSYFADRLGYLIRPWMFQATHAIDPDCLLFLNDYNVISGGYNLNRFKQMAYDFLADDAPLHRLGVQCHMSTGFNPAAVKLRFDSVAEVNLPIWVTEFDISQPDENIRADELEDFYRVAFSHPSVEGILMWGFWEDRHWRDDCYIVNSDWTLNTAGERYEQLLDEWTTDDNSITDSNGIADFRGFYGTYNVTLSPEGSEPTITTIDVTPDGTNEFIIELGDLPAPTTCQQVQDFGLRLPGDLDGDCRVDYSDIYIMIEQWLSTEPQAKLDSYCPDIYFDEEVNLKDFAVLSFDWLIWNNPEVSGCTPNW